MTSREKIEEFNVNCSGSNEDVLFIRKLSPHLSNEQIVIVLEAISTTCNYCWESDSLNCSCYRDD